MTELFKKKIKARIYNFKIFIKNIVQGSRKPVFESRHISDILEKYKNKKKIVVLASGPSANRMTKDTDSLYLITNTGNRIVGDIDFLYYLNDEFYIKRALAKPSIIKQQEVLFFYTDSKQHKSGLDYLLKYLRFFKGKKLYFLTRNIDDEVSVNNYNDFEDFYLRRNLPVKIQNSGMFLLLFGYYMAYNMNLPLEIYGIDLGIGGIVHFDKKGYFGDSVTRDRVKENVKMYLDFMNSEYEGNIRNYSNFNPI